jgi:hypothetical protein
MKVRDEVLRELEALIEEGQQAIHSYRSGDWGYSYSASEEVDLQTYATSAIAAIERIAGRDSEYYRQLPTRPVLLRVEGPGESFIPALTGGLVALRRAVEAGFLVRLEERMRANVYDDFLAQAQDLFDAGYHVAAMVLAGGVLEDHLRKLCDARGVACKGSGSLAKYNDLLRDLLYPQPTWRRIQVVADLRNHAAHGEGAKVRSEDVDDTLHYVGRFFADFPA